MSFQMHCFDEISRRSATAVESIETNLRKVLAICQKPMEVMNISSYVNLKTEQERLIKISSDVLETYVLPRGLWWPFYDTSKSSNSKEEKRILCHRIKGANSGRDDYILRTVQEDKRNVCATIGSPGLGKTSSMNYYFLHFFLNQSLNQNNFEWKKRDFFLRVGKKMSCFISDGHLKIFKLDLSLSDFEKFVKKESRLSSPPMVLLALNENEWDPCFDASFISSTSSAKYSNVFKTCEKGGGVYFLLMDPLSEEEMVAMGEVMCLIGGRKDLTPDVIKNRFHTVGGIPKVVLDSDFNYADYVAALNAIASDESNLAQLTRVTKCEYVESNDFILPLAKLFVSPFVKDYMRVPTLHMFSPNWVFPNTTVSKNDHTYQFRALSPYTAALLNQISTQS